MPKKIATRRLKANIAENNGRMSRTNALPPRGEFVLRGGCVLTMDPTLGDIPSGDVHVRNGEIVAVGKGLKAPGAKVIDARHMIVLPGLIDTHWHMWTTYLRCMAGDAPEDGYFPMTTAYGQAMKPEDMYRGTLLAAAEAIYSGITTVNDECHNVRTYDHALADLRALGEVGLRGRWSYGPYRGMPVEQPRDMANVEKLHRQWKKYSNDGLLSLGFIWGGVGNVASPVSPERFEVARREFDIARRLGIPISIHLSAKENTAPGWIESLARGNFLGNDVLLIHALSASPAEMKMVADSGASISVSPGSELRIGFGLTKACDFSDTGVNVCQGLPRMQILRASRAGIRNDKRSTRPGHRSSGGIAHARQASRPNRRSNRCDQHGGFHRAHSYARRGRRTLKHRYCGCRRPYSQACRKIHRSNPQSDHRWCCCLAGGSRQTGRTEKLGTVIVKSRSRVPSSYPHSGTFAKLVTQ